MLPFPQLRVRLLKLAGSFGDSDLELIARFPQRLFILFLSRAHRARNERAKNKSEEIRAASRIQCKGIKWRHKKIFNQGYGKQHSEQASSRSAEPGAGHNRRNKKKQEW